MKKIVLAALFAALSISPAFAQKTKAQLTTEIGTTYPDNTAGAITPSGVRAYETDVINSIMPTAPVVSGNLACFNGTTGLLQDCGSAPTTVPLTVGVTPINSAVNGNVLYANGSLLGQYSNVQLTALINLATTSLPGTVPAWPNNTTTFFRGDGTYTGIGFNALPTGTSDTVIGYWGSTTASALAVGNCLNALTYNTSTHVFGCNATAGTGTVTQVVCGTGLDGGTITATGTCSLSAARRTLPTISTCITSGTGCSNGGFGGAGTYTTPANVLWLEIYMIGGTGGGGGTGSAGGTSAGGNGGDTCWNTTGAACTTPVYKAAGGAGGAIGSTTTSANGGLGGSGGSSGGGSSTPAASSSGAEGGWGSPGVAATFTGRGGVGAVSSCGNGLQVQGGDGGAGITGGGGGGGGGSPACTYVIINTPAATYTYANGAAGAAGASGTGGNVGLIGVVGKILVIEHYGT